MKCTICTNDVKTGEERYLTRSFVSCGTTVLRETRQIVCPVCFLRSMNSEQTAERSEEGHGLSASDLKLYLENVEDPPFYEPEDELNPEIAFLL